MPAAPASQWQDDWSPLPVNMPAVVFPLQRDGQPDCGARVTGTALRIDGDGVTLRLDAASCPTLALVLGIQTEAGTFHYAGVEVRVAAHDGTGQVMVDVVFGGPGEELLHPRTLTPRFHFDSMTFTFGKAPELLHSWQRLGVLQPVVIDRLLLCPRCHGLPTFRNGCRKCGSGRVVPYQPNLIGPTPESEVEYAPAANGSRADEDTVRTTTAQRRTAYHCEECQWSDAELAPVHQCLHCSHRFLTQQAYEMVLQGYNVQRLEVAALRSTR